MLVFAPLLGLALDYVAPAAARRAPVYAQIVGTIGLLVALPALALWLVETLGNAVLDLDLPALRRGDAGGQRRRASARPRRRCSTRSPASSIDTDQLAVFDCRGRGRRACSGG